MTWVVGASTFWGYGILVSDVQVTFSDGTTADMLQKSYPISNFIVAGFSGSVRIGFMLLESLAQFTQLTQEQLKSQAWDPIWVSNNWWQIAKKVYDSAPVSEKRLGSSILMLGAAPKPHNGIGSKTIITRFASPDFNPGIMTKNIKLCSIGSGSRVTEYKSIKTLFRLKSSAHGTEVSNPGGWGRAIAFSISRELNDHPRSGISRHLNIFHIRTGSIQEYNNNETIHFPNGEQLEILMPSIAQGYQDFLTKSKKINVNSAEAIC